MKTTKLYTKYLVEEEIEPDLPFDNRSKFTMEVKISDKWITFKNIQKNSFNWQFQKSDKKLVKAILDAMIESLKLNK